MTAGGRRFPLPTTTLCRSEGVWCAILHATLPGSPWHWPPGAADAGVLGYAADASRGRSPAGDGSRDPDDMLLATLKFTDQAG